MFRHQWVNSYFLRDVGIHGFMKKIGSNLQILVIGEITIIEGLLLAIKQSSMD